MEKEECTKEMGMFLHQKSHQSLIFLTKTTWAIQRNDGFFVQITFARRNFLENSDGIKFLYQLEPNR